MNSIETLTKAGLDAIHLVTDAALIAISIREKEISALKSHRDELRSALERAEHKLSAYVGVCSGDKELTETVLPMVRTAIANAKGGAA